MFQVKIVCFEIKSLKFINHLIKQKNLKSVSLPKKQKMFVFLKSPHVNKKSKEHFSLKFYNKLVWFNSFKELKLFLFLLPSSIALKITYSGNGAAW